MQKCQAFTIKILMLLAFFTGCSLFFDSGPIIEKDSSLKTQFKSKGWKAVKRSGADYAFQKNDAYLYVKSVCPSPEDNLEKLSMTLLTNDRNIITQRKYNKDKVDILFSEGKFQIEDTNFHIYLTNYKEDECYYEYVLLNQGEISSEMQSDYQAFLNSFRH